MVDAWRRKPGDLGAWPELIYAQGLTNSIAKTQIQARAKTNTKKKK